MDAKPSSERPKEDAKDAPPTNDAEPDQQRQTQSKPEPTLAPEHQEGAANPTSDAATAQPRAAGPATEAERRQPAPQAAAQGERRATTLEPPLGISNVHVIFPTIVEKFIGSYMEYKITFSEGGVQKEVVRRFSDIDELRKALRALNPGILIFPMHPKKFFGSMEKEYLIDRVQELNSFFAYITRFPEIFNQRVLRQFFDPAVNGELLHDACRKVQRPAVEDLLARYQQLFPESSGMLIDMEKRGELIRFKEKIDINVDFYDKFKDVAGELRSKADSYRSGTGEDVITFHEMLQVTFSNEEAKFEEVKTLFKEMNGYEESEGYRLWQLKLSMLVAELGTFNEVYQDLQSLEQLYDKRLVGFNNANQEIERLTSGPQEAQAQARLTQLREEVSVHDTKGKSAYSLMGLLIHKIVTRDIEMLKARKRERFRDIVRHYARLKIEHMQKEIEYWNKVGDFSNARVSNLDSVIRRPPPPAPAPAPAPKPAEGEVRDARNI